VASPGDNFLAGAVSTGGRVRRPALWLFALPVRRDRQGAYLRAPTIAGDQNDTSRPGEAVSRVIELMEFRPVFVSSEAETLIQAADCQRLAVRRKPSMWTPSADLSCDLLARCPPRGSDELPGVRRPIVWPSRVNGRRAQRPFSGTSIFGFPSPRRHTMNLIIDRWVYPSGIPPPAGRQALTVG